MGFLLGVLFGVVVADVDADVTDSGHSKATSWLGDGQDVNVIESKFRRAVVRRKGGLEVAHNEQFLPLYYYELLDSPTLGLLDRELLPIAGRGHLGNGRGVEVLFEDRRLEEGRVLIVLREVWRSVLATTTHNRVECDDEVGAIHCKAGQHATDAGAMQVTYGSLLAKICTRT